MNRAQRLVVVGGVLAMGLVALFPPWRQTYRGRPLVYSEEMGHHFVLTPPKPTGEQSWLIQAPAAECEVVVKTGTMLQELGTVVAFTAILLAFFRGGAAGRAGAGSQSHPVRRLVVTSLLLALCLPLPPSDGPPLVVIVGMALVSPFMDSGHLGPWFAPMLAAGGLVAYFTPVFSILGGITWLARRRAAMVSK